MRMEWDGKNDAMPQGWNHIHAGFVIDLDAEEEIPPLYYTVIRATKNTLDWN